MTYFEIKLVCGVNINVTRGGIELNKATENTDSIFNKSLWKQR